MGQGSFFAVIEKNLYVFGGMNDEDYFDGIYMLDLEAFHWQQLPDLISKPSPKSFGGMVAHFDYLVMVGGVGKTPFQPSDKGSYFTCIRTQRYHSLIPRFIVILMQELGMRLWIPLQPPTTHPSECQFEWCPPWTCA